MAKQVPPMNQKAQVWLGTGAAFIALGAVAVSVGSDSTYGWLGGMVLIFAGAAVIGMGVAANRKK